MLAKSKVCLFEISGEPGPVYFAGWFLLTINTSLSNEGIPEHQRMSHTHPGPQSTPKRSPISAVTRVGGTGWIYGCTFSLRRRLVQSLAEFTHVCSRITNRKWMESRGGITCWEGASRHVGGICLRDPDTPKNDRYCQYSLLNKCTHPVKPWTISIWPQWTALDSFETGRFPCLTVRIYQHLPRWESSCQNECSRGRKLSISASPGMQRLTVTRVGQ